MFLGFLLGFFRIRILSTSLFLFGAFDEGDLKLEDVCITGKLELYFLRGTVHKDSHVQEGCAELNWVDVVVALEHDLETTLLILERAVLVLIEVAHTDQFLVSIKSYRDILPAKSCFCLNCVSLGGFKMTASLKLNPHLSWLIDCQIELQGLDRHLVMSEGGIHARKLLLYKIHFWRDI